MTVDKLQEALKLNIITGAVGAGRDITGCYIGDFLSVVMGKAKSGDVWITVMNNVNVAAVATLCDVACILLCEDTEPDENLKKRAQTENIPILKSPLTAYELALKIGTLL